MSGTQQVTEQNLYVVYSQGESEDWIQAIFLHEEDADEYIERNIFLIKRKANYTKTIDWLRITLDP